jgi:hypothetical protein
LLVFLIAVAPGASFSFLCQCIGREDFKLENSTANTIDALNADAEEGWMVEAH